MKVTSVEPQKKNIHRFSIFLDGQFAFGADEDLVVDHRLVVGKVIEPGEMDAILYDGEVGKLMERIYGLSNIRQRSEKEVRDFLKKLSFKRKFKGQEEISLIVVESAVERAIKKGLINDEQFARSWIEARSKKYGKIKIKQELFQKGIDREIVEQVLSSEYQESNEEEIAKHALEKKIKIWKNLHPLEFRKKAYQFLMRKGFEHSLAKEVVEKFLKK